MSKSEAHRILDAARRGEWVSPHQITEALKATGDLLPMPIFPRTEPKQDEHD